MIGFRKFLENNVTQGWPWEWTPGIQVFVTSQGSTYLFKNGISIRHKAPHVGHEKTDVGVKRSSVKTYFVNPQDATRIGMWNSLQGRSKRLVVKNGWLALVSRPRDGSSDWGFDDNTRDNPIKIVSETPTVGLSPVEMFEKVSPDARMGGEWYRDTHPGNAITEIIPANKQHHQFFKNAASNNT